MNLFWRIQNYILNLFNATTMIFSIIFVRLHLSEFKADRSKHSNKIHQKMYWSFLKRLIESGFRRGPCGENIPKWNEVRLQPEAANYRLSEFRYSLGKPNNSRILCRNFSLSERHV